MLFNNMFILLFVRRNPVIILEEKSLRLAHHFAEQSAQDLFACHLSGSIDVYPGKRICLFFDSKYEIRVWKLNLSPWKLCLVVSVTLKSFYTLKQYSGVRGEFEDNQDQKHYYYNFFHVL